MNRNIKNIIQNYLLQSLREVKIHKSKCLEELLDKTDIINTYLKHIIYYDKYCININMTKYYSHRIIHRGKNSKISYWNYWEISCYY